MRGGFFAGSAREKPPLTGEVAERSDGRKRRAGHARPLQRSKMKGKAPHHVIFNARCTRYTMYLNSPAIRLNSTQT